MEPRTGPSTLGVVSPVLSRGKRSPPSTCWQNFSQYISGYHQPSLPQGYIAHSCPTSTRTSKLLSFCQESCLPFCQAAFQLGCSQHILVHEVVHASSAPSGMVLEFAAFSESSHHFSDYYCYLFPCSPWRKSPGCLGGKKITYR